LEDRGKEFLTYICTEYSVYNIIHHIRVSDYGYENPNQNIRLAFNDYLKQLKKMDKYTVMTSLSGILALIAIVALLTFGEDIGKWFRYRMLKRRKNRRIGLSGRAGSDDKDFLFRDKKETLFMAHAKNEIESLTGEVLQEKKELI
jgi:hypothetical protein